MTIKPNRLLIIKYRVITAALLFGILMQVVPEVVSAAQLQSSSRFVKMSSATPGATAVTYQVGFTLAQTQNLQGVVVEFCNESPIIGSTTCTKPGSGSTAFTVGTPSATVSANFTTAGTWTFGSLNTGRTFYANNTTTNSVASGTAGTITITTMTNDDTVGTLYARIYTYGTSGQAASYTLATPGAYNDYGGVAMSTTNAVNVSATVQEQLTFCVASVTITSGCANAAANPPNITLGSGSPLTLSTTLATASVYHQITSNAVNGVSVALKNTNASATCAGLSRNGGTTCGIAAVGSGTSAAAINTGDGTFGVRVAAGSGGTGAVAVQGIYNNVTYAMRNQTYNTVYGDPISASSGATADVVSQLTYGAAAATATPAGVYTITQSLVATGTY